MCQFGVPQWGPLRAKLLILFNTRSENPFLRNPQKLPRFINKELLQEERKRPSLATRRISQRFMLAFLSAHFNPFFSRI